MSRNVPLRCFWKSFRISKKLENETFYYMNFQHRGEILFHLHPLIWIFKRFCCPKWFWQKKIHKKSTHLDHSYQKYTLIWPMYISVHPVLFYSLPYNIGSIFRSQKNDISSFQVFFWIRECLKKEEKFLQW